MVNQIALELQKILCGEFECFLPYYLSWIAVPERLCCEAFVYGAPGPQQTDANRSFGPSMSARDLLDLISFQVVPRQDHSIVLFASLQNSPYINGGQIHLGRRGQLRQRLKERFTAH